MKVWQIELFLLTNAGSSPSVRRASKFGNAASDPTYGSDHSRVSGNSISYLCVLKVPLSSYGVTYHQLKLPFTYFFKLGVDLTHFVSVHMHFCM